MSIRHLTCINMARFTRWNIRERNEDTRFSFQPDVPFHWNAWLSYGILRRSACVVMSPRSLHRAVNRDATFGTEAHYFSYSLTIRPWTRGGDSEAEEEPFSGGPSALLEVRRRRKCPAAIVWGRFNKRRCHRTRFSRSLPLLLSPTFRSGCFRILTYGWRLVAAISTLRLLDSNFKASIKLWMDLIFCRMRSIGAGEGRSLH